MTKTKVFPKPGSRKFCDSGLKVLGRELVLVPASTSFSSFMFYLITQPLKTSLQTIKNIVNKQTNNSALSKKSVRTFAEIQEKLHLWVEPIIIVVNWCIRLRLTLCSAQALDNNRQLT